MKKSLALLLFIVGSNVYAQRIEGEIELVGFVLGQYRDIVHRQLGPPIEKKRTDEGWIYEFHALKPDTSVYALFKYAQWDTTRIYGIQVNGDRYDDMHPFRGLKLGASKETVNRMLGKYESTEAVQDPPVVTQYYLNKNYSVDIHNNGYLFGIQIFGNILATKPNEEVHTLKHFKDAIIAKNVDSLITYLAPDVEIYKSGKVIRYDGAAREEFKKSNSELVKHLLGDSESVWYAFAREYAKGTSEVRLHPEDKIMSSVDKFFGSAVIDEIVFIPHAGKWKVYEIKFR